MRFFKVDDFTVGTGLGLSICRAIVEKLGGKIWAESEQGKGTTMYYTLPMNNLNKEVVIMDDIRKEQDIPEKQPIMSSEQNIKTILIAEDIETNYHLLKVILSKKYNLLRAVNGSEAVNLFIEHKPDLILMDIKMPIMNGLDATREIRKISNDVVIIAQTANAFESDVELAKDAGCNDFITKPIRHKDLLAIIEKHLI
ncbi:Aerobic respiration control sensor protein ArcB [bioreactor metagenome]|uniref:histidine kinase n=1 Tax=bioreactor metagenome TaxID=1076179 RepID=A0A645BA08_9ZZZZ